MQRKTDALCLSHKKLPTHGVHHYAIRVSIDGHEQRADVKVAGGAHTMEREGAVLPMLQLIHPRRIEEHIVPARRSFCETLRPGSTSLAV